MDKSLGDFLITPACVIAKVTKWASLLYLKPWIRRVSNTKWYPSQELNTGPLILRPVQYPIATRTNDGLAVNLNRPTAKLAKVCIQREVWNTQTCSWIALCFSNTSSMGAGIKPEALNFSSSWKHINHNELLPQRNADIEICADVCFILLQVHTGLVVTQVYIEKMFNKDIEIVSECSFSPLSAIIIAKW